MSSLISALSSASCLGLSSSRFIKICLILLGIFFAGRRKKIAVRLKHTPVNAFLAMLLQMQVSFIALACSTLSTAELAFVEVRGRVSAAQA